MVKARTDFLSDRQVLRIDEQTKDEWLETRREGVGGSDFGAILGEHPYRSRLRVWLEKLGRKQVEDNRFLWWGRRMESLILERLEDLTGLSVYDFPVLLRSPNCERMQSSPDGLIDVDDRLFMSGLEGPGLVEAKNPSEWSRDEWGEAVEDMRSELTEDAEPAEIMRMIRSRGDAPGWYRYQLWHNLHVAGLRWGVLCACIGGNGLYATIVRRDEGPSFESSVRAVRNFWNYVESEEEPPPDPTSDAADILTELHPETTGEYISLPHEARDWIRSYQSAKNVQKLAKKKKREARNHLMAMVGDNLGGFIGEKQVKFTPIEPTEVSYTRDGYRRINISDRDS